MPLRIPAYSELDREQIEILNIPLQGKHLVVGPPGSGKTVMALHRAQMFGLANVHNLFLTHGKALSKYLEQAVYDTPGVGGGAFTMHAWLHDFYRKYFNRSFPHIGEWGVDWMQVLRDVDAMLKGKDKVFRPYGHFRPYDHLVIDEGQDFAKELYLVAPSLAEHITVFADENQRLWPDNATIREISAHLGVDASCCGPHFIHKNHRNTRQIALLAAEFYAGAVSGIPELPDRQGETPAVFETRALGNQGRYIGNFARTYTDASIGVICPDAETVNELAKWIRKFAPATLVQSQPAQFDFRTPGVMLVTYQTAKGLEFDSVFLVALDRLTYSETVVWKMRLYVAIARARNSLYLMYSGDRPPFMDRIPSGLLDWHELPAPQVNASQGSQ